MICSRGRPLWTLKSQRTLVPLNRVSSSLPLKRRPKTAVSMCSAECCRGSVAGMGYSLRGGTDLTPAPSPQGKGCVLPPPHGRGREGAVNSLAMMLLRKSTTSHLTRSTCLKPQRWYIAIRSAAFSQVSRARNFTWFFLQWSSTVWYSLLPRPVPCRAGSTPNCPKKLTSSRR